MWQRIKDDDNPEVRKRWTITDEQNKRLLDTIEALEKSKGSPPNFLQLRQELVRIKAPEFTNDKGVTVMTPIDR